MAQAKQFTGDVAVKHQSNASEEQPTYRFFHKKYPVKWMKNRPKHLPQNTEKNIQKSQLKNPKALKSFAGHIRRIERNR